MPGQVLSVVNMKGGVGKSTTAVMLAETHARFHDKRVLIIDLDPQTNASIVLMGEEAWRSAYDRRHTVLEYFYPFAFRDEPVRSIVDFVVEKVSDLAEAPDISVLPCTPQFGLFERDVLARMVELGFHVPAIQTQVSERLRAGIEVARARYDLVIFDCPPGISVFAEAAIKLSDALVVPTIPDPLSGLGLMLFRGRARKWMNVKAGDRDPVWVAATKFQEDVDIHHSELENLRAEPQLQVLDTVMPQDAVIAQAARWSPVPRSFEAKYGRRAGIVKALGDEVARKVLAHERASVS